MRITIMCANRSCYGCMSLFNKQGLGKNGNHTRQSCILRMSAVLIIRVGVTPPGRGVAAAALCGAEAEEQRDPVLRPGLDHRGRHTGERLRHGSGSSAHARQSGRACRSVLAVLGATAHHRANADVSALQ